MVKRVKASQRYYVHEGAIGAWAFVDPIQQDGIPSQSWHGEAFHSAYHKAYSPSQLRSHYPSSTSAFQIPHAFSPPVY